MASASLPATDTSLPETAVQIQKDVYRRLECYASEEFCQVEAGGTADTVYLENLFNSYDPRDHVVWSYGGNEHAMCNDIRKISISNAVTTSQRFVNAMFVIAFVCLLGYLVGGGPVTLDRFGSLGAAGFTQLAHWCSFPWVDPSRGGFASRTRECISKRRLRGFADAAPMIPLSTQLSRYILPSTPSAVFNVRKGSSGRDVITDWEALAELQRNCALRVHTGRSARPTARYTLPTKAQNGDTIIQIPRIMSLSSLTGPTYLRKACNVPQQTLTSSISWLWGGSASRPCSSDEFLAFSVFVEKHLQRQALREALRTKMEPSTQQNVFNSLPPHLYCLVKSNRKNAPFFTSKQWEALRQLTFLRRETVDAFSKKVRMIIQEASAAGRGMYVNDHSASVALQAMASDCDEELLDLDIKDAVSVFYSKRVADGEEHEAILPAAMEFEAGLDTYTWNIGAHDFGFRSDYQGFERVAVGDSLSGSVARERQKNFRLVCDYQTVFTSKSFGYGAFSLNKYAPMGGVQKEQYQCIRAMLWGQSFANVEEDATHKNFATLAAAEVAAAGFFLNTCKRQLDKSKKAVELLHSTRKPTAKATNTSPDARRTSGTKEEENLLFLGAESEHETTQRSLEISRMMLEAVNAEQDLLWRCITYFSDVRERAIRLM